MDDYVVGAQKRSATAVKSRRFLRGWLLSNTGKAKDSPPQNFHTLPDFLRGFEIVKHLGDVCISLGFHVFPRAISIPNFFDKKSRESG